MAFLSTLTAEQQVAAIYIGYYDRAADPTGENFWEGAVANPNLSLADIATDFSTQSETQAVHPFFANPTAEEANAFITSLYLNLFNREPDADGLTFWSGVLQAAIDGTGTKTVGQIIIEIIEGAQNVPGGTQDLTTILNKIEVATAWTSAADAAGIDYNTDTGAQTSAKSIIEGVTDSQDTVVSAKATIDDFFVPAPVPGDEFLLTSATDVISGTADDDEFNAYIQQNPFAGGVSNSLSSADRLDGGAGNDRLYAEVTGEFVGVVGNVSTIDIQPRTNNIEEIDIEARESTFLTAENFLLGGPVVVDGKNIKDHEELSSYYSDGDLKFENVTTLTSEGVARDTSTITIGMDHTDNFNSDGDASDLTVLFDNDYLLARGETSVGQVFYFLLDEQAEQDGNPNRLNNIDVDGLRFDITNADGSVTEVRLQSDAANVAGTHQGFVNALQAPLQALIADGTLPAGTTLVLDPTITDTTFTDNGQESDTIPAMVLTSGDGSKVEATGFTRIEEPIGEYDVYGQFESEFNTDPEPIHIDIDLYKAGRGGEGGDLIIGGKTENTPDGILDGIEVFKINVKGAGNDDPNGLLTKPSNLGTITSTGNELREVYIATDPMDAVGDTFASLTVRNGFDQFTNSDGESGDLELINADAFLGDLTLGGAPFGAVNNAGRIVNADTITAQGGGDVNLGLDYNGSETAQAYSVTTAGGDDIIDILIDGDAVDYAGSSLNVMTGGGDDAVYIDGTDINIGDFDVTNERLNQTILDNITVETGDGDDTIVTSIDSKGDLNINAGSGDDFIDTSGGRGNNSYAEWTFNFDDAREADPETSDVPGVPLSLAYVGGATVTVILSGAGSDINGLGNGGGIMETEAVNPVGVAGAVNSINGYEASATIGTLINGNRFYGDQRDVNAAVVEAVTNDPVLSKLITLTLTENNTWVATMNTGGQFTEVDLRVEISQKNQTSWSAVEEEAQSVFSNSGIAVTSVASANTPTGFNLQTTYGADGIDDGPITNDGSHLEGTDGWYTGLSAKGDNNNAAEFSNGGSTDGARSLLETDNVINPGTGDDLVVLSTDDAALRNTPNYTPLPGTSPETARNGNTLQNGASNETIIFQSLDFGDDTIMNFQTAITEERLNDEDQVVVTATGTDGVPANSDAPIAEVFTLDVNAVPATATAYDVTFDGVTTNIPLNSTPAEVATLVAASYSTASAGGWTAVNSGGGIVTFTQSGNPGDQTPDVTVPNDWDSSTPAFEDNAVVVTTTQGADSGGVNPAVPSTVTLTFVDEALETLTNGDITILGSTYTVTDGMTASDIADLVAATPPALYTVTSNSAGVLVLEGPATMLPAPMVTDGAIDGTFVTDVVAFGLDFLDYSDYLTSQFDSSAGAGDSADSNILIPVTLDYSQTNTLGGSGDGSTNVAVEANEVAIVRMANDTTDGETFASLTASDVANLFNNGAGYTGFGGDANFGDLNAGNFNVQTYQKTNQEALIGDGKAIFKVENPNNLGEYKVFELTWDGDATSASGATVSAVEIGTQDFGTSLTGLDDVNLVGSQDYADLIQNGFYDPLV